MEETRKSSFEVDLYIRDTVPLTDEEFRDMMSYDNDDISIDELDFDLVII